MVRLLTAPLRWSRALYDWVLHWAKSRHSRTALFFLSLAEASFFPIPPDPLLIALCMGDHRRWVRFALLCSVGSVIGGMLGYAIGYGAFELIGSKILELIASMSGGNPEEMLATARFWFDEKEIGGVRVGAWAVGVAGFTPIPYKVFTIAAGFFEMNFFVFVLASVISRSARFFFVGGLIGILYEKYGERITLFIDRYFDWLAIAFVLLLVAGFFVIKVV
ncbi:DedA family protein [candidate division GN15 bacterium]|jgi:membrane protein YqaA with SNARE-associated domain|nr:DedA family protein [candidate division GN15 bacterium]